MIKSPLLHPYTISVFLPVPLELVLGTAQEVAVLDIAASFERSIKNLLISILSRKGYYQYHSAKRPVTPDVEATIRQTLLAYGWTQEPTFDNYVEEYLW